MNNFSDFCTFVLIILAVYFVFLYNWKRKRLYYLASQLPGPLAFPLIGSAYRLSRKREECLTDLMDLVAQYPPIFKVWFGINLYIITSRPQDLQKVLSSALEKGDVYDLFVGDLKPNLLTAPTEVWKARRKLINQSFNIKVINSFLPLFVKQANNLVDNLTENCAFDAFPKIWKATFLASCETLGDADSDLLERKDEFLSAIFRFEDTLTQRFFNPLLHFNLFWKLSSLRKEVLNLYGQIFGFVQQMIDVNKNFVPNEGVKHAESSNKRFLSHLLQLRQKDNSFDEVIFGETPTMLLASSETSAVAISSVLLILGMYPVAQEKIFEELSSVFGDSNRDVNLEDLNRLDYLERVIKETMRLLPPVPLILRTLDKDVSLGSYVLPAGCRVLVPITNLHRSADLWPDPFSFDPDRFLPEEIKKRHPCAYLPFSFGPRNCIGLKYAMVSMKSFLSTILRRYKVVKTLDYKGVEDIEIMFYLVGKAKKDYRIILEQRNQ